MTEPCDASVVMPVHDRAHLVTRALDSIAGQTRPPARIICIDDASRDDGVAVIRAWSAAHPAIPLTLIEQPTNAGPAAARNAGIRAATTARIAFLDSDDAWRPDALATLVHLADAHPAAVLVAGEAAVLADGADTGGRLLWPYLDRLGADAVAPTGRSDAQRLVDAPAALLSTSPIPTCACLFDRRAALAIGAMPDFRMGEDWLFFLGLALNGDVVVTRAILADVHRHQANITGPAASLAIAAEHLRALHALTDDALPFALPSRLRAPLAAAMAVKARDWRYFASRAGWPAYRAALASPLGRRAGGARQLLTDPRATVRALLVRRPAA